MGYKCADGSCEQKGEQGDGTGGSDCHDDDEMIKINDELKRMSASVTYSRNI